MPDEAFQATKVDVLTKPEELFIPWDSLSIEQQNSELRAAIRCKIVQETARKSTTVMDLPADEDINARTGLSASLTVQSFIQWFAEGYKHGMTPIRSRFLMQEALAAIKTPTILDAYKFQTGITDEDAVNLVMWAVATSPQMNSLFPVNMIDRDVPSMTAPATRDIGSAATRGASKARGFQSSKAIYVELSMDELPDELENPQFRHFRSWYQGGLVMLSIFTRDICLDRNAKLAAAKSTKAVNSAKGARPPQAVVDFRPVTASSLPPEDKRAAKMKTQEFSSERMKERSLFF